MCEPSESELTRQTADAVGGGAHRGEDKSTGLGVPTHTPNPARSAGCSPRRRRLTSWQMSLMLPLQQQPEVSTRIDTSR